jgi:hypothetical protein
VQQTRSRSLHRRYASSKRIILPLDESTIPPKKLILSNPAESTRTS